MRRFFVRWPLALLLLCSACPITERPPQAAEAAIPSTPLPEEVSLELSGTYTHAGTGLVFPAMSSGFARVGGHRYDREGNHVRVGYNRMWPPVVLTVYVYPRAAMEGGALPWADRVEAEEAAVRDGKPGIVEVRRAVSTATFGARTAAVHSLEWHVPLDEVFGLPVTTALLLVDLDPWALKVRVTLPAAHRDDGLSVVDALLAELRLPPLPFRASGK